MGGRTGTGGVAGCLIEIPSYHHCRTQLTDKKYHVKSETYEGDMSSLYCTKCEVFCWPGEGQDARDMTESEIAEHIGRLIDKNNERIISSASKSPQLNPHRTLIMQI